MLEIVKAIRAGALAALGLCALGSAALAQPVSEEELDRWVPAVGFSLGVAADRFEGHINTTDVLGPQDTNPVPPNPEPRLVTGSPATDRTVMIIPSFGGSFELMTPGWKRLWGKPRAFGRVDVSYVFGPEYNTPALGNPGELSVPSSITGGFTEGNILGQGARTTVSTAPLLVTAGGGFAFTMEAGGRRMRIKPSVEYMRHEVEVDGYLKRAVQLFQSGNTSLDRFREVTLSGTERRVYHMLGPGLEVDVDVTRAGDFIVSPYLGLKAWVLLDNSKIVVDDSNEFGEAATFTFLPNRWAFGGAVGVRFRWAPE